MGHEVLNYLGVTYRQGFCQSSECEHLFSCWFLRLVAQNHLRDLSQASGGSPSRVDPETVPGRNKRSRSPVFNHQFWDAAKFPCIMRNQYQTQAPCMGSNEQVIWPRSWFPIFSGERGSARSAEMIGPGRRVLRCNPEKHSVRIHPAVGAERLRRRKPILTS